MSGKFTADEWEDLARNWNGEMIFEKQYLNNRYEILGFDDDYKAVLQPEMDGWNLMVEHKEANHEKREYETLFFNEHKLRAILYKIIELNIEDRDKAIDRKMEQSKKDFEDKGLRDLCDDISAQSIMEALKR